MYRAEAVSIIKSFVQSIKEITCAWEGGSVATGYSDELSDLDLLLICYEKDMEIVLTKMMGFSKKDLELKDPIEYLNWHGISQVYVKTKNTLEFFYVDFVVLSHDNTSKMTEKNRHGIIELWVDDVSINNDPLDQLEIQKICKSLYIKIIAHDFVLILELKKAVERGVDLELYPFYIAFQRCHTAIKYTRTTS